MKSKYTVLISSFLLACTVVLTSTIGISPVFADNCTTQYGGTEVCPPQDLVINKLVLEPSIQTKGGITTGSFVENLSTDKPFAPGSEVVFKLIVRNASGETFARVTVQDVFPSYLTYISGPGSYDANTRTLTFIMENLPAGQNRSQEILAKVADANTLSALPQTFCITNVSRVSAQGRNDEDTAQLCIGKAGTITQLPVAGFSDYFLILPFIALGAAGLLLTRKTA